MYPTLIPLAIALACLIVALCVSISQPRGRHAVRPAPQHQPDHPVAPSPIRIEVKCDPNPSLAAIAKITAALEKVRDLQAATGVNGAAALKQAQASPVKRKPATRRR